MRVRIQRTTIRPTHFAPPLLALLSLLAEPLFSWALPEGGAALLSALRALPLLLFLLFAYLALRLNGVTLLLSSLVYLTAWLALDRAGPGLAFRACAYALTVPAGLTLLWAIGERRLLSGWSAARLAALALPLALLLLRRAAPLAVRELFNLRLLPPVPGWSLPDLALPLAGGLALLLALARPDGDGPFRYALPWTLFPLLNALAIALQAGHSFRRVLAVNAAFIFLILLYGLFRLYWQRVYLDELTGIPNRRSFNERLRALGPRYALAMIDIDHFKTFNDTYGHPEGDNVLRWVARHAAQATGGRAYRYGGEEFAVVFAGAREREAEAGLERLRRDLERSEFAIRSPGRPKRGGWSRLRRGRGEAGKVRVHITVSAGWARAGRGLRRPGDVLRRADEALYQAKKAGRNRVEAAVEEDPEKGPGGRCPPGPD